MAKAANLEGINVNYKGLSNEVFIEKVHAAGLELFTWTVNSPTEARRLANLGLKGITTDRPAWLKILFPMPVFLIIIFLFFLFFIILFFI